MKENAIRPTSDEVALVLSATEAELAHEQERKKSLEQRGITVITTSGTLVTLVFALTTVVQKGKAFEVFLRRERVWLQTSLLLFVIAATLALLVNLPRGYHALQIRDLRLLLGIESKHEPSIQESKPQLSNEGAHVVIARKQTGVLFFARKLNSFKAWSLVFAIAFEVSAVACLAWAAFRIMEHL